MLTYSFDVRVSDHDALKRGVVAKRLYGAQHDWHRVVVAVDDGDEVDAALVAHAMASCHGLVIEILLRV